MPIFKKSINSTSLQNKFLQNKDISLAAKGLLGYMLSLPNDWKFTIEGIAKQTGESSTKIIKLLKELQLFGYHTKKHVYENGRIKEWVYYTFAEPRQDIIDNTFDADLFEKEIQDLQKQDSRKQDSCFCPVKHNNINIINGINNTSNFSNKKIKNESNTSKNIIKEKKLTKKQLKEKKEQEEDIKINNLIDKFTDDADIQELLEQYVEVRKNRANLTSAQFYIMLDDLKKECGQDIEYTKNCIKKAIAGGWSQIVFIDKFKGNAKTSYSSVDNTANHKSGNPKISDLDFRFMTFEARKDYISHMDLADMTKDQREFFDKYCLARDENGNLLKF